MPPRLRTRAWMPAEVLHPRRGRAEGARGRDADGAVAQQLLDLGGRIRRVRLARRELAAHGEQALGAEAQERDGEAGELDAVTAGQPLDRGGRGGVEAAGKI